MKRQLCALSSFLLGALTLFAADDYKPGPDSLPQPGIPKGEMLKDKYIAAENSVFPGTEREYQIYLPAIYPFTKASSWPFMVFQDGVIYQAPTVFDNLIAKKEIPPLIGIFIKPGVVPAANDNALPRFNRSYEYDSVSDNYSRFLIDEFLPAIKARHKLNLSDDPNARGIAGSSSGGICAFMVAWHRPDSFRRVFTSVGTYVGIHGADQLPVLVRKFEPKPIRIHLQSGENDNNLYCGDWWMANQMMERSLTWNGYDVNHTWGTGGHNQKHATAIFPDVLRWLWKGYPDEPVKANPRGDAKWRGYEVVDANGWKKVFQTPPDEYPSYQQIITTADGNLYAIGNGKLYRLQEQSLVNVPTKWDRIDAAAATQNGNLRLAVPHLSASNDICSQFVTITPEGSQLGDPAIIKSGTDNDYPHLGTLCCAADGTSYATDNIENMIFWHKPDGTVGDLRNDFTSEWGQRPRPCLSPDQTQIYIPAGYNDRMEIAVLQIIPAKPHLIHAEWFYRLEDIPGSNREIGGLCVDIEGRLYASTAAGIQVCDQAGRVNFIIPTPKQPYDVCFGGKDLSELFIACGDTIYKRQTKAHGYISGQMAPIKPPPPKL